MKKFLDQIIIGGKQVGRDASVFIIAEAGVNHNGDMAKARKLIDVAKSAGADAIKFQFFKTEELILKDIPKATYQRATTGSSESQYDMLKKLEVSLEDTRALNKYADEKGIVFLTTPFDEYSLDLLDDCNLLAYKIASTDTTNLTFLSRVAQKGKPIILSTGMSYFSEVEKAVKTIKAITNKLIVLQCTANYPTPIDEVNLRVIDKYKQTFDTIVGFSDHTEGIGASPYAVARGAKVIEKHFTLDKNDEGPDHKASLEPQELKQLVSEIRAVEQMLGEDHKTPTLSELDSRASLQKCLVTKQPLKAGDELMPNSLIAKRTGGKGISPIYLNKIAGRQLAEDLEEGSILELKHLV